MKDVLEKDESPLETMACPNCEESIWVPLGKSADGKFPCPKCSYLISRPATTAGHPPEKEPGPVSVSNDPGAVMAATEGPSLPDTIRFFLLGGVGVFFFIALMRVLEVQGPFDLGLVGVMDLLSPDGVMGLSAIIVIAVLLSTAAWFFPKWVCVLLFGWYLVVLVPAMLAGDFLVDQFLLRAFCPSANEVVAAVKRFEADRGKAPTDLQEIVPHYLPAIPKPGVGPDGTFGFTPARTESDGTRAPWSLRVRVRYRGRNARLEFSGSQAEMDRMLRVRMLERVRKIGDWLFVEGPLLLS